MSNGFKVDEEKAYESMTNATMLNGNYPGVATMYAVVCISEDHTSHGGYVADDAQTAVESAKEANEHVGEEHPCHYIPLAIGLDMATAAEVLGQYRKAHGPDDDL